MRSYTSKAGQPVPFELDGVQFETVGAVPLLEISEMAKLADVDAGSPEGAAAISRFFEAALGRSGYVRFRTHCNTHGTDPDTLLAIFQDLCEEMGQVPTPRPSPSAAGPTAADTASTYKVVSSSGSVTSLPLTEERRAELAEAVRRAAAAG